VTVNSLPAPITGSLYVCIEQNTKLDNITTGGTWSSGAPDIATVQYVSGQVRGISTGTATIYYTMSTGCYRTTNITVNPTPAAPVLGTIRQPSLDHPAGSAELTGLPPGNWIINPGAIVGSGTSHTVDGLKPGSYEFTVTNECGNISPATKVIIDEIPAVDFKVSFPSGWSWFSVNAEHKSMTPGNILGSCTTSGDYIKDQTRSATYYSGYGWYGSLTEIDPVRLYKVKVHNNCGINFTGKPVDINTTTISLVAGWNWIGYLPQVAQNVNDALSSVSFTHLDYIKNQTSSATYYQASGWYGSLDELSPSEGYMMKLAKPGTLKYSDPPGKKSLQVLISDSETVFNPGEFEFNGSITARIIMDEQPLSSENGLLFAFVNDQIRGVSGSQYFEPLDQWLYTLMIHSNLSDGEKIEFRYYDPENNKLYNCREKIRFNKDMIIADAYNSFELNINTSDLNSWTAFNKDLQLNTYPNPFNGNLNIEYEIIETSQVRLSVFDPLGRLIRLLVDQTMEPGHYSVLLNSPPGSGVTYLIRLESGHRQKIQRVTLFK
jgi:hypothetical protein